MIPPFSPRIYVDGCGQHYEDGRVYGAVDLHDLPDGGIGLVISEWSSHFRDRGHSVAALQWLRTQTTRITANGVGKVDDGVPNIATLYWAHMMGKGLIDAMLDDDGRELVVTPDGEIAYKDHLETPLTVEAMSIQVEALARGESTPLTADKLMDHLHGRTTTELQSLMLDALRDGFMDALNTSGFRQSFATVCVVSGRFELLERIVRAGPPVCKRLSTLRNSGCGWIDWLCNYTGAPWRTEGIVIGNPFDTVLQTLCPDSVKLLRLAHELDPGDRNLVMEAQGCYPVRDETLFPGNLHYSLLHVAMNGGHPSGAAHSRVTKKEPYKVQVDARSLSRHAVALECLAFLRSVGNIPQYNLRTNLDAMVFVTGFNLGSRYEDVRALMGAYRDAGHLDIDCPIHKERRTFGGRNPLEVAISSGAAGAAAALIDMGCDLAPCGDPLAVAEKAGRPHVTAAVAEALMRKQLTAAVSEQLAKNTPAPPRRRRAEL